MLSKLSGFFNQITKNIFDIIESDDVELLAKIIRSKQQAIDCYDDGAPLFFRVCSRDAYRCLLWLLKLNVNPDAFVNSVKWTPLRFAAENKLESLARLLMIHGADPDLSLLGKYTLTPRKVADEQLKKIIIETETLFRSLQTLKTDCDKIKTQGDTAYKLPNMLQAREYYKQAAEICRDISQIWNQLQQSENDNPVFKEYYQKQREFYSSRAEELDNLVSIPNSASIKIFDDQEPQLTQRKVAVRKQQTQLEESQIKSFDITPGLY